METTGESRPMAGKSIKDIAKPPRLNSPGIKPPGADKKLTTEGASVDEEQILKWLMLPEEKD